jgi:hypothetical protein
MVQEFYRFTFNLRRDDVIRLRAFLSERGPDPSLSPFFRSLIDAAVDFVINVDRISPEEEGVINECGEKIEAEGTWHGERISITIRPDQLVTLGELAKGLEMSRARVLRLLLELWREGLLDRWLPNSFRLCPKAPREEEIAKLGEIVRG